MHLPPPVGDRFLVNYDARSLSWHGPDAHGLSTIHPFFWRAVDGAHVDYRRQRMARRALRRHLPARRAADDRAIAVRSGRARRRDPVAEIPLYHFADADADHRRGNDFQRAVHVHRFPVDLRADARRSAQRDAPDATFRSSAQSRAAISAKARRRDGDGAVLSPPYCFVFRPAAQAWQQGGGDK